MINDLIWYAVFGAGFLLGFTKAILSTPIGATLALATIVLIVIKVIPRKMCRRR